MWIHAQVAHSDKRAGSERVMWLLWVGAAGEGGGDLG